MFQFSAYPSFTYVFSKRYHINDWLPHSEIFGSKLFGSSPKHIAAVHVLLRYFRPRHPPYALMLSIFWLLVPIYRDLFGLLQYYLNNCSLKSKARKLCFSGFSRQAMLINYNFVLIDITSKFDVLSYTYSHFKVQISGFLLHLSNSF